MVRVEDTGRPLGHARAAFKPVSAIYSPDLNPIEHGLRKFKHLMRMAAERTVKNTWRRVGTLIDTLTPQECANYLKNVGYASVSTRTALKGFWSDLLNLQRLGIVELG